MPLLNPCENLRILQTNLRPCHPRANLSPTFSDFWSPFADFWSPFAYFWAPYVDFFRLFMLFLGIRYAQIPNNHGTKSTFTHKSEPPKPLQKRFHPTPQINASNRPVSILKFTDTTPKPGCPMPNLSAQVILHIKRADTVPGVIDPIRNRWSPRAWLDKPVSREDLCTLLEAARWAASSNNEQPWRFLVATKDNPDEFARLLSVLNGRNQLWAKAAPVLLLAVCKKTFSHNGKPNRHGMYDTGAAAQLFCIQAAAMGLATHQMAGYDPAKARELFHIPDDFEPGAAMALGYAGPADSLPEDFQKSERAPRTRKPLPELAFTTAWGTPANL
jgi:nitroreductase